MRGRAQRLNRGIAYQRLRDAGMSIRWCGDVGEYRVNFAHGHEASAYYTSDLQDALDTGLTMAARREATL